MKTFEDVINDIEKLKGIQLSSLSGTAKGITVTEVDRDAKRVKVKTDDGDGDSRSFEELQKIWDVLKKHEFAHVESILSGSGSSRNRPETILASLPYIDWAHVDGKKCLIYVDKDDHELGKAKKLDDNALLQYKRIVEEKRKSIEYNTDVKNNYPLNRIIFGAPGTGKSHMLEADRKSLLNNGGDYERVTFYPDYTYSKFVGAYKPVSEDKDIVYEFVPGPFVRILVKAINSIKEGNPRPYLLLIEEINRAPVAAVFGDVFQLLDREDNGVSQYEIETSEDLRKYLAKELGGEPEQYEKIKIPNNMFIWATMNSADQGVFPMDTAFKRRWDFTYLGIDTNDALLHGKMVTVGSAESQKIEWNRLRQAINLFLSDDLKVNEDKQLGPYFLSKDIVVPQGDEINPDKFADAFKNKVLMYLFEDAARQRRNELFEGVKEERNRYSHICDEFDRRGINIFNRKIVDAVPVITEQQNDSGVAE